MQRPLFQLLCHLFISFPKWQVFFEGELGGLISGVDFGEHGGSEFFRVGFEVLKNELGNGEAVSGDLKTFEEGFFDELDVPMISRGQILGDVLDGKLVTLDKADISPEDFEEIGVFLLRHNAGAGDEIVRKAEKLISVAEIEEQVVRASAEGEHNLGEDA